MKRDCRCPLARHVHGTYESYASCRCRCFACRVASAERRREFTAGVRTEWSLPLIDRLGTARRLEALHAIGWSGAELGRELGTSAEGVRLMRERSSMITVGVAERVAVLFARLWDAPRSGPVAVRTRRWAAGRGWLPPAAWNDIDDPADTPNLGGHGDFLDDVAIERACAGDPVGLTSAERAEAVARLTAAGVSANEIARRLRVTGRTVIRRRGAA